MESKLKALKVADLKEILSRAQVTVPARATKADLVAKILAAQPALDAYAQKYAPLPTKPATDDLLAPLEEPDWSLEDQVTPSEPALVAAPAPAPVPAAKPAAPASPPKPAAKPTSPPKPVLKSPPKPTSPEKIPTTPTAPAPTTAAAATKADEEEQKRIARAARFGIPVVQTASPKYPAKSANGKAKPANLATAPPLGGKAPAAAGDTAAPADDPDKLKNRAERFGINTVPPPAPVASKSAATATTISSKMGGRKRVAPANEVVDAEEAERRRKRAERFGLNGAGANA